MVINFCQPLTGEKNKVKKEKKKKRKKDSVCT